MPRTLLLVLALALALAAGSLGAVEVGGPEFSFEGPRIVGADLGLSWDSLKLTAGAGYENWEFGRDAAGVPKARRSDWWIADGTLRLQQTWKVAETDLWTAVGTTAFSSLGAEPQASLTGDLAGSVFGFFQTGVTWNRFIRGPHGVREGTAIQAFVEAGPALASSSGSDYYKVSFRSAALVPLWNLEAPAHLFSGSLGFRANAQWTDGTEVPFLLLEPTEVRGYHQMLDTRFRSVATAEWRVGLPSLWNDHDLVPMVFAFTEGGYYAGYANAPAAVSGRNGWLASAGTGFGLSVMGLTTVNATVALPLADTESDLWWTANFNLRF